MKRFIILACFILAACSTPTSPTIQVDKPATEAPPISTPITSTPTTSETPATTNIAPSVHMYNSAWKIVKEETLITQAKALGLNSRSLTSLDGLKAERDAFNAAHTDDQWIIVEGDIVPIENAPDAPVFIVNSATLEIYFSGVVPRADLVVRREAWRTSVECMADPDTGINVPCTLYVDNVPPTPPVIVPPAPKLWVALLDITAHVSFYVQHFDTEAAAQNQYRMLCSQADLNSAGLGDGNGNIGDVWQAYIGETEYAF